MDPRIQAQAESVKSELHSADHITPEHRDILELQLADALACANGALDKLPLIASVVATGAMNSMRQELRLDARMSSAVKKGLEGLQHDIKASFDSALSTHMANCSARQGRSGSRARRNPRDMKLSERALDYWFKMLDTSPIISGLAILFAIYKVILLIVTTLGSDNLRSVIVKVF